MLLVSSRTRLGAGRGGDFDVSPPKWAGFKRFDE